MAAKTVAVQTRDMIEVICGRLDGVAVSGTFQLWVSDVSEVGCSHDIELSVYSDDEEEEPKTFYVTIEGDGS